MGRWAADYTSTRQLNTMMHLAGKYHGKGIDRLKGLLRMYIATVS